MILKSMFRLHLAVNALTLGLVLFSSLARADSDPCDSYINPIKWESELSHPLAYDLPAVFYPTDNSQVIVSAKTLINDIQNNMADHEPFLKNAKAYILDSLTRLPKAQVIDVKDLMMAMDGLQGEALTTAIHVMNGYQLAFESLLLNHEASVSVDGVLVSSSHVAYRVSRDPDPSTNHDFDVVHQVVASRSNEIVFSRCWLATE